MASVKRHPAFQDLSRDHLVANTRALHVIRAVEGHPMAPAFEQAIYNFEGLWTHEGLATHFEEEEADLLPVLRKRHPELAERLQQEHDLLRAGFAAVVNKTADRNAAVQTARALMAHARWEDDVVFEWLQNNLSESELQALLAMSKSFRTAQGMPLGQSR